MAMRKDREERGSWEPTKPFYVFVQHLARQPTEGICCILSVPLKGKGRP